MELKKLTHDEVLSLLPDRKADTHKGDYGRLLLLCGSKGYTGAAALAAMGALRTGAGLVCLGVPESIYAVEAGKLLEPVIYPLPENRGMLSADSIHQISKLLPRMNVVLIGPGLGQSDGTLQVVNYILKNFSGPVVLDADGINVLAEHRDILRGRTSATVLTPHEGEFLRLGGLLEAGRIKGAVRMARDLNATVALKGHETVITDGSYCYSNPTGNPGMAVGGSGDMLAGMVAALLGQGMPTLEAVACAVWLHGAAGDICAREIGQYGMLPSDMLQVLPRLMK